MRQRLKERLVGAALLALIGVVFIPMLLSGPVDPARISANIPKRPDYEPLPRLQPLPLEAIMPGPGAEIEAAENRDDSGERPGMAALRAPSAADIAAEKGLAALQDEPEKPEKAAQAVKSEQAEKAVTIARAAPPAGRQVGLSAWVVQLGAFDSQEKADQLMRRLKQAGFRAFMEPVTGNTQAAYRVRVGPELLRSEADKLQRDIKAAMKLDGIVLDYP